MQKSFAPLLLSVFLLVTGNGVLSTLIPLRARLEGFSDGVGIIRRSLRTSRAERHGDDVGQAAAGNIQTSAELVELLMQMSGNEILAGYIRDFALRIGRYVRLGLATLERRNA